MLSQQEKDTLQSFLNNEPLISVIKKVFYITIESKKPEVGGADNELIGQQYRAYDLSKQIVESGFTDLLGYKINKNPVKEFNKER